MSEDYQPEPRRQVWHFALLVPAIFAMLASQLLGARPLFYGAFNNVAPAGVAPASMTPDDWTLTVHRSDWRPPIAASLGHTTPDRPARLGWVVREFSVLSMPIAGWRQSPLAAYREDAYGYRVAGLYADQLAAAARDGAAGWFPWWRFVWGWLPLLAVAAFVRAELGWQARRRDVLGII